MNRDTDNGQRGDRSNAVFNVVDSGPAAMVSLTTGMRFGRLTAIGDIASER